MSHCKHVGYYQYLKSKICLLCYIKCSFIFGVKMENKSFIDRTPLRSKKFILASVWSLCWVVLLVMGFMKNADSSVLTAMVYVAGMVQALYLGGQSAVDALVRAAVARRSPPEE